MIEEDRSTTKNYILHIFGDNGMKFETSVTTIPAVRNQMPEDTHLILDHYGNDYYIDKMWVQGKDYGYQFLKPEILKSRERERSESASVPGRYVRAANDGKFPVPATDRDSYQAADRAQPQDPGAAPMTNPEFANEFLNREAHHEIIMLPYYGVFDNIDCRVDGNTVTLVGQVTRPTLKADAESAVRRIQGVDEVVNSIEVLPASANDDRVRAAAYRAIYGNASMTAYTTHAVPPIHIIVNNGNVTLVGTVISQTDKDNAYVQANTLQGVTSVANDLRVGS
jgi:hyperosmotically inducible protein